MTGASTPSRIVTPRVSVGGVGVTPYPMDEVIAALDRMIQSGVRHQCITVAVWQVYLTKADPAFRKAASDADMVLCDGFPVLLASRFTRTPIPEIAAGVDTVGRFAELAAKKGYSMFVLGSAQDTLDRAYSLLKERYGAFRFGSYSPPFNESFDDAESKRMVEAVNAFAPDLMYACMGTPKGEVWVNRHFGELNAKVTLGVGGAFDTVSGKVERAPAWVRKLGLEGFVRTVQDPRPRVQRNMASMRVFPGMVLRDLRSQGARDAKGASP